jgi:hypothetical protein
MQSFATRISPRWGSMEEQRNCYKNAAPLELNTECNLLLQECRSSGAERQNSRTSTRMPFRRSSIQNTTVCYKNAVLPERKGWNNIMLKDAVPLELKYKKFPKDHHSPSA